MCVCLCVSLSWWVGESTGSSSGRAMPAAGVGSASSSAIWCSPNLGNSPADVDSQVSLSHTHTHSHTRTNTSLSLLSLSVSLSLSRTHTLTHSQALPLPLSPPALPFPPSLSLVHACFYLSLAMHVLVLACLLSHMLSLPISPYGFPVLLRQYILAVAHTLYARARTHTHTYTHSQHTLTHSLSLSHTHTHTNPKHSTKVARRASSSSITKYWRWILIKSYRPCYFSSYGPCNFLSWFTSGTSGNCKDGKMGYLKTKRIRFCNTR
jgi:hypothetical protein